MNVSFKLTRMSRWMLACAAISVGSVEATTTQELLLKAVVQDANGQRIVPTKPKQVKALPLKQRGSLGGFSDDGGLLDQDAALMNTNGQESSEAKHKLLSELALSRTRVNDTLTPETTALFGDQIDLNSGAISFLNTDISIPGNSELSVGITRTYRSATASYGQSLPFADWQLAIPAISTDIVYGLAGFLGPQTGFAGSWGANKACSGPLQPAAQQEAGYFLAANHYWSGDRLHIPGVIDEPLMQPSDPQQGTRTIKNWKVTCIIAPSGTEGFRVTSPQGVTYEFTKLKLVPAMVPLYRPGEEGTSFELQRFYAFMQVTKVTDRFNNSVDYLYDADGQLTQISANDGRVIDLRYESGSPHPRIKEIEANGQIWQYQYETIANRDRLTKVIQPDGRFWEYQLLSAGGSAHLVVKETYTTNEGVGSDVLEEQCIPQPTGLSQEQVIKHPNGARFGFQLQAVLFGRSQVPIAKVKGSNFIDRCSASSSLARKTLSGPGLTPMTWNYQYSQNPGAYVNLPAENYHQPRPLTLPAGISGNPGGIPRMDLRSTQVTAPDGSITLHVFDRRFNSVSEGQEVATYQWDVDGTTLLRSTSRTFSAGVPAIPGKVSMQGRIDLNRPGFMGAPYTFENVLTSEQRALKVSEVVTSYAQGLATDTFTTQYANYNTYGTAEQITETNSLHALMRTTTLSHQHDTSNWVLNLETNRQVQQGDEDISVASATYYGPSHIAKALLHSQSQFGQLQQTHEYFSTGLLKKTTYASASRWMAFDDYKRGKPQKITLPNRYDTSFFNINLVVNNSGTIASATDLNGNATNYSYDSMHRLTLIDPVDSRWLNTSISYENDTTGVGALQQHVSRGDYRKTITLDALLQPVLTKEWDLTNEAQTVRYTRQQFNSYGKAIFSSVPSQSPDESFGSSTRYDGLQRMLSQTNTAQGDLTYRYGANNSITVTNGKGYSTTTDYLAFGSPQTKLPLKIQQPESVSTLMSYNAADLPVSISQGGITETRLYNANMQLCLQQRPETGIKALQYNVFGEVQRYAEGLTGGGSTCTDYTNASNSWVTQTYDNLGSPRVTSYLDGTSIKTATLDKQGNLLSLVNGANSWTYSYNSMNLPEQQSLTLDGKTFTTNLVYNNHGHLQSKQYGGATLTYAPNSLGQPTQVRDTQTYASNVQYHPNGQLKSYTYGNGLTFTQTLDSQFKPYERQVKSGNTLRQGQRYRYDNNDNLDAITDLVQSNQSISMTFDGLDRLTTAAGSWGNGSFSYDVMGNITNKQLGSQNLTYNYHNTHKRLSSVTGGYSFQYDDRGNVIFNGKRGFVFNRANQLTGSGTMGYQYDGHGLRVKKTGSSTGYSVYDLSGTLILTEGPNGQTRYIHLGKELIAKVGSAAALEDKPGYTGHVEDKDLSLTYMQQRYYDPVIGRFYSNDPVGFTASNPMMFNRYAYGNNNPYKYVDPDGGIPIIVVPLVFIAKEIAGEFASHATGGALDFLSVRRMGMHAVKHIGGNTWKSTSQDFSKSIEHIFSIDHIKNGVMNLGNYKSDVVFSGFDTLIKFDNADLLKPGSNMINTTINGVEATVRANFKDGNLRSMNIMVGHSKPKAGWNVVSDKDLKSVRLGSRIKR